MTICLPYIADAAELDAGGLPSLDAEPELSYAQLGLTDTLLGDGQYGQTMLVSFCLFEGSLVVSKLNVAFMHVCEIA